MALRADMNLKWDQLTRLWEQLLWTEPSEAWRQVGDSLKSLNWLRIAAFVVILFLATFVASFVVHRLAYEYFWMPDSELFGVAAAVLASASLVFLFLSLMRSKQPWLQALVVGLACWVISFPINVLILGQRPIEWALGGLVLLFSVSIGTRIGIYLRKRADLTSNDVE